MKYQGIELPYQLAKKLAAFSKRGIGPLYVLLEPVGYSNTDTFTRIDNLFKNATTLADLTKEFGEKAKLSTVLDTLFKGRRRLATSAEQKDYDELIGRSKKWVAEQKAMKSKRLARIEAAELERAKKIIAKHEGKKNAAPC